jgi:hypothetical protein
MELYTILCERKHSGKITLYCVDKISTIKIAEDLYSTRLYEFIQIHHPDTTVADESWGTPHSASSGPRSHSVR